MTALFGFILVCAVAAAIAFPLLRPDPWTYEFTEEEGIRERLRREKNVSLIAIKEAEFDHAMGKLSPDDYAVLKGDYEERALGAIEKLSKDSPAPATDGDGTGLAKYCMRCGGKFPGPASFCPGCGSARSSSSAA